MLRPLSFWLILFSAYLYGVGVANISGTVTDIYKNPLPGANVLIQNTVFGGVTDLNGVYNISVSTKPGETQFTVIPLEATSFARVFVKPSIAAFDAT